LRLRETPRAVQDLPARPVLAHDKLVRASMSQVRGWAEVHKGSTAPPIVLGEFKRLGWRTTLSFKNLIDTNGLLRQYYPKGMDLSAVSQAQLNLVARKLNTRPRKTLNWKTPAYTFSNQVFRRSIEAK
jgi:hypothetical protein